MNRLQRTARRWSARLAPARGDFRFLANSFPKSGTHLLTSLLAALPGVRDSGLVLTPKKVQPTGAGGDGREKAWLASPEQSNLGGFLRGAKPGQFVTAHLPFSPALADFLIAQGARPFFMYRDPRDVAVSHAFYIARARRTRRHTYFNDVLKTPDEWLMAAIKGVRPEDNVRGGGLSKDLGERLSRYAGWLTHPGVCAVRFEKLVGPRGGGLEAEQLAEIEHIAEFCGVKLSGAQVRAAGERAFSPASVTFRKGQIGDWQNHFEEKHKQAFKAVAGELLIELGYAENGNW